MKCGRPKCKVCRLNLDEDVEYLHSEGLGYRKISRRLGWKVSHMGIKRHLDALKNNGAKGGTS